MSLSETTIQKLQQIGFSIRKGEETFIEVTREAIAEIGGKEWQKGDLPRFFRELEEAITVPLCADPNGPRLSRDTFRHYMSAARKCLLFNVPFRMGWRISRDDLPKVAKIVQADSSARNKDEKVIDAIRTIRAEKRKVTKPVGQFVRLPLPVAGEEWTPRLFDTLRQVLESAEAKALTKKNPDLRRLAKLVTKGKRAGEEREAVEWAKNGF
jgi:hypothetical protein